MDFNYVVQRKEKGKVCFGSGLERVTLEADTKGLVSKFARQNMRENLTGVGPGTYNIFSLTSATSALMNKPTSKLGTVLGGRKAERKALFTTQLLNPGPGVYDVGHPLPFKQMKAPFNTASGRKTQITLNTPGVGTYNLNPRKCRTPAFAHSFGGKKYLLPTVKTKCSPFNFDTCERCQKFPEGDYWSLDTVEGVKPAKLKKVKQGNSDGIFLCRGCYELEKQENTIFNKGQMRNFKKMRDCSQIHFHNGCKAKVFLVLPQEIAKVEEREAYLGLYFN